MFRFRLLLIAVVTASVLHVTSHRACALIVPLRSPKHVPFRLGYPEHAQKQVRAVLGTESSRFINGQIFNAVTTLHFRGDTNALNEMLQGLADCPAATIAVSFQVLDHKYDWKIIYDARSIKFQAIINLKSNQLSLEKLTIPPAKGPELNHQGRDIPGNTRYRCPRSLRLPAWQSPGSLSASWSPRHDHRNLSSG